MAKTISLAGFLKLGNIGDNFIVDTVEYLIKNNEHDFEIQYINFENPTINIKNFFKFLKLKILTKFTKNKEEKYKYIYQLYKLKYGSKIKKQVYNSDAIIFAGGSFKYETQYVWAMYSVIVEYAKEKNIPVMFDAMNIQKFNEKDWRCLCLKEHLNYDNVKCITTRDGENGKQRLLEYYVTNKNLLVDDVGDPAFWIPETYQVKGQTGGGEPCVGINLISKNQFLTYGGTKTPEDVVKVYVDIIKYFNEKKIKWELFTNGLSWDLNLVQDICKELKIKRHKIKIRKPKTTGDLIHIISGYKAIIGARLHALICAYSLDIPIVGMIWDEKLLSFSKVADVQSQFFAEQNLDGRVMAEKLIQSLDLKYDTEKRDFWKKKTFNSLNNFINDLYSQK